MSKPIEFGRPWWEVMNDLSKENARLKAEVERLTEVIRREVDGGVNLREEAQRTVEENHNLRAEVERLRKAGDALYENQLEGMQIVGWEVEDCPLMMEWNAAKEGKQP